VWLSPVPGLLRHGHTGSGGVRFHENGSRIFHQMALALGHNTLDSEPSRLRVRLTSRRGVGATGAQRAISG
jgi:hypothetical protein